MASTLSSTRTPLEQLHRQVQRYRTNTLQTLRREARNHQDRLRDEALEQLRRAECRPIRNSDPQFVLAHSILDSARRIVTPVIASLNIEPDLNLTVTSTWTQHWLKVHTNYQTINLQMASYALPSVIPGHAEIAEILTTVKALIYHEVGHLLFSTAFADLIGEALFQGADAPILAAQDSSSESMERHIWAYGLLDDQRMECALVKMSPIFADYLTTSTMTMIVGVAAETDAVGDIWPMVCGRSYLPDDHLMELRHRGVAFARRHGLINELMVIEREVAAFKRATREREMWEAVDRVLPAMRAWFEGRRTYTTLEHSAHSIFKFRPLASACPNPFRADVPAGATETPSLPDIDDDGTPAPPTANIPGGGTGFATDNSSSRPRPHIDPETIEHLTPLAEVAQVVGRCLPKQVREVDRNTSLTPMTGPQLQNTHLVRSEVLDLLMPLTSQSDPTWRFRRDDGILDPVVYLLREPGDISYWTALDEQGHTSPTVAVSLVLDSSYSMQGTIADLFVAAIGFRLACDELGVSCTLSTFADDASIVFDADDPTQEVVGHPYGGTNPIDALSDLASQRHGKDHHLVIIFTDGVWGDVPHLTHFRSGDEVIIGVTLDRSTARSLTGHGFDEIIVLDSVTEFASAAMTALVPYFT